MTEAVPASGPGEVLVYETTNFQVRVGDQGWGVLVYRGTDDMVSGHTIPQTEAGLVVEMAEIGFQKGVASAANSIIASAKRVVGEIPSSTSGCFMPKIEKKGRND